MSAEDIALKSFERLIELFTRGGGRILVAAMVAGSSMIAAVATAEPVGDTSIRPFKFQASAQALSDLRQRVTATQWPEQETVTDATQGVRLATMQQVAGYWGTDYDWRKAEARLNSYPQFITTLDGLDIHFIHVRSKQPNALPIVITHGWPGSIIAQLKIIDPLTDPVAHGRSAAEAFDVVIPSLPGYGFSGKPAATGWDPQRVARAWAVLMTRLGYTRFVAQGGDWGNAVTEQMALQRPPGLIGIHTNMPATVPADIEKALQLGNRPQTLYAIADSPIGLAGWMLDHDARSQELIARVFDGKEEGLTRDDVLDNITLYWLTNTAVSSARLYWESKLPFFAPKQVAIPTAISVFPDEIYAPRAAGRSGRIPSSFTSIRCPKAVTSRRGSSRSSS